VVAGVFESITWILYENEELYEVTLMFEDGILYSISAYKGFSGFNLVYSMDRGWIGEAGVMGVKVEFTVNEEEVDRLIERVRDELVTTTLIREEYDNW
jgi:hypothetical protein